MADSELIQALDRLRTFATWSAVPPADPWALAAFWLAGAECRRAWPELRVIVRGGLDDAIHQANTLVDRLRDPKTFSAKRGFFSSSPAIPVDVVDDVEKIAITLRHPKVASLAERLTVRGDLVISKLPPEAVSLAGLIDSVADLVEGWGRDKEDWADAEAALTPLSNGSRLQPSALATAAVAWHLVNEWSRRQRDRKAWSKLKDWLAGWFANAGLVGGLAFGGIDRDSANATCRIAFDSLPEIGHATLTLSVRDSLESSPWRAMPEPPGCGHAAPTVLKRYHADPDPACEAAAQVAFAEDLNRADGAAWFDALLKAAASADGVEADWWFFLRERGWVRAFPDLHREYGSKVVSWPASAPLHWPRVTARRSSLPDGHVFSIERYATTPTEAKAVVSVGKPAEGSALDAFCQLFESDSGREALWGGNRWFTAYSLSRKPGDPLAAVDLAEAWYAAVQTDASATDRIEAWLNALGIDVIHPDCAKEGELDERFSFGDTGVSQRGYKSAERLLRPAVRVVNGGPEPQGFAELLHAAKALPAGTGTPGAVGRLAEAARGGYLAESALELFAGYWDQRPAKPDDPTRRFGEALNRFLHALGFEPFDPKSIHDHPDGWVTPSPGSRLVNGSVRRVYRPGLLDDRGEMRIPALAEVD